jgi:hypothetical protein
VSVSPVTVVVCCGHGEHAGVLQALADINTKLEKIMTDQDTANQIASQLEADVAAINSNVALALTEIADLEAKVAAGQPVDFTVLRQAVSDIDSSASGVAGVATAAAPPAAPAV